jgi:glycosyltransferase involved in cell wall biosynthesis
VQPLRERLGLPRDRPVLLFTGRLARTKGLLTLAEAFRSVVEREPRPLLVLLGTGERSFDDCEPELRRLAAEPPLAGSLLLPGNVPDPVPWLQSADLFVFPSEYEGFGLSIVEAVAAGLPIITTPVGAATEVVRPGVNGWLVPIADGPALAAALDEALGARETWPALGAAGRAVVVERFGLESVLDRYVELLRRLTAT